MKKIFLKRGCWRAVEDERMRETEKFSFESDERYILLLRRKRQDEREAKEMKEREREIYF